MKETLNFIQQGAEVTRYHTVTTLMRETVGHHSHGVACLCLLLNPLAGRSLLIAALQHDLAECETGDIPAHSKRRYGIGGQVHALELEILRSSGLVYPTLTAEEERTLKMADIAQGALYSAREIELGNQRMRVVFDRYISYAEAMMPLGRERELFNTLKELVCPR